MKVVPLSQRSGILEWCEGTVPMGEYLIGNNGAHQRYRPNDWKAVDCRKKMSVRLHHSTVLLLTLSASLLVVKLDTDTRVCDSVCECVTV